MEKELNWISIDYRVGGLASRAWRAYQVAEPAIQITQKANYVAESLLLQNSAQHESLIALARRQTSQFILSLSPFLANSDTLVGAGLHCFVWRRARVRLGSQFEPLAGD